MRQAFDSGVAYMLAAGVKPLLYEELFGPSSLIVRAASVVEAIQVLNAVGGSLTVTLWGVDAPTADNQALVRVAMGRFLRLVSLQDAPAWLLARNGRPCW
jgi:acyl-CoA reductase-like NAD-dependent aldehyde dehydrogenase